MLIFLLSPNRKDVKKGTICESITRDQGLVNVATARVTLGKCN